MLIKNADDHSAELQALASLAARRDIPASSQRRADEELRKLRAGVEGERQAAYEIERTFGRLSQYGTIHDLRFEIDGYSVQIDHLVLNLLGEIWICESKHFADGATVNDRGEWSRRWAGKLQGMESPIAQNRHHILMLSRAFDDGLVPKYRRLRVPFRPTLRSLVLISKDARMVWPRKRLADLDEVIKVEEIDKHIRDAIDAAPSRKILTVVTPGQMRAMGEGLVHLHQPKPTDWAARLLPPGGPMQTLEAPRDLASVGATMASGQLGFRPSKPSPVAAGRQCALCGGPITQAEVYFSTVKLRGVHGGRAVCRRCQESEAVAGSA